MSDVEPGYNQGELIWTKYPLTDKVNKLKKRPVLIISNQSSTGSDGDYIVLPITKTLREEPFSLIIEPTDVTGELPTVSELRCNKPFTIRKILLDEKIGTLTDAKMEQAIRLAIEAIAYWPKQVSAKEARFE